MGSGRRRLVVGTVLLAGLAMLAIVVHHRGQRSRLAARLILDEVIAELPVPVPADAVQVAPADDPVRAGALAPQPGFLSIEAGARRALIAPPTSRVRWQPMIDGDAVLAFAVAVERAVPPVRDGSAVRFRVLVDGEERWSETLDANRRRDRRWVDARVHLTATASRPPGIVLETTAVGQRPLAGRPGWHHPRVLRQHLRERQRASSTAPSVLVLLVDALRADALGCYGNAGARTPSIDRLAVEGRRFEWAIAQAPWTAPAVATIFTGLHPRSHGVVGAWNDDGHASMTRGSGEVFLADALPTLAEAAADAGITTVGVSANPLISRATNFAQGFETFEEFGWDAGARNWAPAATVVDRFTTWLEVNRSLRFLAYLHLMEPHDPYTPPPGNVTAPPSPVRPAVAHGRAHELAASLQTPGTPPLAAHEVGHLRALYDAEVAALDRAVGALRTKLTTLGVADSTLVVLLGDHGEEFLEHGGLTHRRQVTDEVLRVPFVLTGPGVAPGVVSEPVQQVDVFPTLSARLGLPPVRDLPGLDVLAHTPARPTFVETEFAPGPDGQDTELLAVRTAGTKLLWWPTHDRFALYDLVHDPGEHVDRFTRDDPLAAGLAGALAAFGREAPLPPTVAGQDPALRERLRALGYAE